MTTNTPARFADVDDLLDARADALGAFDDAIRSLQTAERRLQTVGLRSTLMYGVVADLSLYGDARKSQGEKLRKEIDRSLWQHLGEKTGLLNLMDAESRSAWQKDIERHAPECTRDALEATFRTLHESRDLIFERGLVNAFAKLSGHYRTNDPFKLGPRIIITGCGSRTSYGRDRLADAERVLYVLDGQRPPDGHDTGVRRALNEATGNGWSVPRAASFETEYLSGRIFKNGNVHVSIRSDELREKANRVIAKYYGAVMPDGRRAP